MEMMRRKWVKWIIVGIAIFTLFLFGHRTNHAFVNEVTGSRKGWTELGGFLRVGEWYSETKLETFAKENDIPFDDEWVLSGRANEIACSGVSMSAEANAWPMGGLHAFPWPRRS